MVCFKNSLEGVEVLTKEWCKFKSFGNYLGEYLFEFILLLNLLLPFSIFKSITKLPELERLKN